MPPAVLNWWAKHKRYDRKRKVKAVVSALLLLSKELAEAAKKIEASKNPGEGFIILGQMLGKVDKLAKAGLAEKD